MADMYEALKQKHERRELYEQQGLKLCRLLATVLAGNDAATSREATIAPERVRTLSAHTVAVAEEQKKEQEREKDSERERQSTGGPEVEEERRANVNVPEQPRQAELEMDDEDANADFAIDVVGKLSGDAL